jgi:hypothetical protein
MVCWIFTLVSLKGVLKNQIAKDYNLEKKKGGKNGKIHVSLLGYHFKCLKFL